MIQAFLLGDIIERNISKKVFLAFILISLAISTIDFLFLLMTELGELSASYSAINAFNYSLQIMPYRIYDMLAYFCLLSSIVGLGSLVDQGEIAASRALGKSFYKIILASFRPTFVIVLIGLFSSEIWIPQLSQQAEEERSLSRGSISFDSNYWISKDSQIIHIKSIPNDKKLQGISIYEINKESQLVAIITASSAININDSWKLEGIKIDLKGKDPMTSIDRNNYWVNGPNYFDLQPILSHRYLSISELIERISSDETKVKKDKASLEFWKKILQPFITLGLMLLASSMLFGPMRDNKGGLRLIFGIGIALIVDLLQKLFGSISLVTTLSAFWALIIPILLILIISFLNFRRF